RRRLRRLAWAMLSIAAERRIAKEPDDVVVDRLLGPRHLILVDQLQPDIAGLLTGVDPVTDLGVEVALQHVRAAVRRGDAAAPELLGLLRDALARRPQRHGHQAITSKVLALATIISRERRDISGVQPARELLALAHEQLETLPAGRVLDPEKQPVAAAVIS